MKQHVCRLLCLCLLPALLLSGCWQEDLPDEEDLFPAEDLTEETTSSNAILPELLSLPYAPKLTLDPITCSDGMQQVIASLICEGLFHLGPDLEPTPWLCESYTYDAATFTYVFTLRSGICFSDGTALTGHDVKAALTRAKSSQRYGSRLAQVSSISAGERTVTVTLSAANSGFPALLDIPISKSGTDDLIPIGTGPYRFAYEDGNARLLTNQSWWQGISQPVSRIALVEAGDQDTMLYRFTSHDVQLITADLAGTDPISATGSVVYQDVDTTVLHYLGCNVNREPLNNASFRQLLSRGIDRTTLVSAYLSGHGTAAQFPVSPVSPLYPQTLETPYSHAELSAALAEAGYTGRTLTLLVNEENSFKCAAAREIARNFTSAGLPVTVNALPWAEYTAALAAGNFDLYYGEVKLSADWDLSALLGTGGTLNYGRWADPATDQLLASYAAAEDRAAAIKRLCTHLQNQAPILPICFKSTSVLMQSNVFEGLTSTMTEPFYNLTECIIHLKPS